MWAWSLKFLANCTAARNRANTLIKVKLCTYSLKETAEVTAETNIAWDRSQSGALYLYRDPDHFRAGSANMRMLMDEGVAANFLDTEALAALEPALAPDQGALRRRHPYTRGRGRRRAEIHGRAGRGLQAAWRRFPSWQHDHPA